MLVNVKDFPGYRVSDEGDVETCRLMGSKGGLGEEWRPMTPSKKDSGHLFVRLRRDGKYHTRYIHVLVLEAFVGPCPPGLEACHSPDRNPANNNVANLRWDTHAENIRDRTRHGTGNEGEKHGAHVLTEAKIEEARRRIELGETQTAVAESFGVDQSAISRALSGARWKHLQTASQRGG